MIKNSDISCLLNRKWYKLKQNVFSSYLEIVLIKALLKRTTFDPKKTTTFGSPAFTCSRCCNYSCIALHLISSHLISLMVLAKKAIRCLSKSYKSFIKIWLRRKTSSSPIDAKPSRPKQTQQVRFILTDHTMLLLITKNIINILSHYTSKIKNVYFFY